MPKDAIIVVGNADKPTAGEDELREILERALQFNLVTLADDNELARDFDPGLVIISSSVNASTLNDEWANERAPIVVMDDEVWPFMGVNLVDSGTLNLRDSNGIEVVQPDHPILNNIPDPCNLQLADDDGLVPFVIPENPDSAILRVKGGRGEALMIFEFEMGDELSSVDNEEPMIARHRRLGFFVNEADIINLPPDGKLLFMNTLLYAWSGSIDRF